MSAEKLFPPLSLESRKLLERFGAVLDEVTPLKGKHRLELRGNIRRLSETLTEKRENLGNDYMGDPSNTSAYLRYFLPWNLFRLSRLFGGLEIDVPEDGVVADFGAGPLTAMIALWIAKPELRARRLTFVCVDRTPKPMRDGLRLFEALTGEGGKNWRATLVKGGIGMRLREDADLVIAANTLNEMSWTGRDTDFETGARLALSLIKGLKDTGRLLLVETGLRRSARILSLLRGELLELGYQPMAPCTHGGECAMHGAGTTPWCHFNFDALDAPAWLKKLTATANLTKQNASLSFLYAARGEAQHGVLVRAVSEIFPLPPIHRGQYGCSDRGLTLLRYGIGGPTLFPGQTIAANWPETPEIDRKSGAVILPVPHDALPPLRGPRLADAQPPFASPSARPDREAAKGSTNRRDKDGKRPPAKSPAGRESTPKSGGGAGKPTGGKGPSDRSGRKPSKPAGPKNSGGPARSKGPGPKSSGSKRSGSKGPKK